MPDLLTLTGVVATEPRHITTNSGLEITSFRLASGQRRYDREKGRWVDADTNWYTVSGFRQLAQNLATSIQVGQHVLVTGRLRVRAWENGEKSGTTVEVEADAVGHDLCWGTSVYVKTIASGGPGGESARRDDAETWAPSSGGPGAGAPVDPGHAIGSEALAEVEAPTGAEEVAVPF